MSEKKMHRAAAGCGQNSRRGALHRARGGLTLCTFGALLRADPLLTAGLVLSILAAACFGLIPPQLLRRILDGPLTSGDLSPLGALAAAYVLALAAVGAADFAKNVLLTTAGQRLVHRLRSAMWQKLSRVESRWFSLGDAASTTSRFLADADNVSSLFTDGLAGMAVDCLKIVGILVSIALFSPWLLALAAAFLPAIWFVTRHFKRRSLAAQVKNLEQLGRVNSHIAETIKTMPLVRGFAKEGFMEQGYAARLRGNFETLQAVNLYDAVYPAILTVLKSTAICAVVLLAGPGALPGLTIGTAAAAIELFSNLFSPLESLGMELQSIQKGISGIERIDAFAALPEEPPCDPTLTAQAVLDKNGGAASLSFADVSFAYEADEPVLHHVSFTVPTGQSVTLAGRTGVGKTTLFRLAMGLLAPDEGSVLLNGVPVRAIPNSEKRRLLGYVEQRFSFIEGTVAEQISLGDAAVSRADVQAALRFVGLEDTVAALPQGMDTPAAANAAGFSQGQQQLLAIARAIAGRPAVLLLDEVTANLDSATEARVVGVLAKAGEGRTILSISHRLTAMLRCDKLVRIENGCVAGEGTPQDEL